MVEFTQPNGAKCMVASDSVSAIFPGPPNGKRYRAIICIKAWSEEGSIEVMEEYEAVKQALKSDDWERSNGRC